MAQGYTSEVTLTFAASKEQVFEAFTNPELVARWWGTEASAEADLRVGGMFRWGMKFPDGDRYYITGAYQEITPPDRLVCSFAWEGGDGTVSQVTVQLREVEGGTELTLTHEGNATEQEAENHRLGWHDCASRMQRVL